MSSLDLEAGQLWLASLRETNEVVSTLFVLFRAPFPNKWNPSDPPYWRCIEVIAATGRTSEVWWSGGAHDDDEAIICYKRLA